MATDGRNCERTLKDNPFFTGTVAAHYGVNTSLKRTCATILALITICSVGTSCSMTDLATRPSTRADARLQLVPRFQGTPPSGLDAVATQLTVQLRRADQSIVADTTVLMAPTQQSVGILFTLPDVTTSEPLSVRIRFADETGVLLYRGDVPDIRADGREVPVPINYSGPNTLTVADDAVALTTIGATALLGASVRDPEGVPIPETRVFWETSNPSVVTVDSTGVVTGLTAGTATILPQAYGLTGPPITVTVANRYAWLGEDGDMLDASKWLGGRVPTRDADIDFTADGDYTVTLNQDWYAAASNWFVGAPGNGGQQTLLVNEGDIALGAVLSAQSVRIAPSGVIDATDWLLDAASFINEGLLIVRRSMVLGGPYMGTATSTLQMGDSSPLLLFESRWESGSLGPEAPPGGPVTNAGLLTGNGFIFFIGRPEGMENYGTIAPRPRLLVDGELLLGGGSAVSIRADGLQPQDEHDLLHGLKGVTIDGGTLELTPTFLPSLSSSFAPLLGRTVTGTFSSITGLILPDSRVLEPRYRSDGLDIVCCAP